MPPAMCPEMRAHPMRGGDRRQGRGENTLPGPQETRHQETRLNQAQPGSTGPQETEHQETRLNRAAGDQAPGNQTGCAGGLRVRT